MKEQTQGPDTSLRVTLLGSGSPSPSLARCHPSVLVEWGETAKVLVDAGDGVVGQILRSGTDLGSIHRVALTHMHWDHILGYPGFVWGSWIAGRGSLQTWGPTGTRDMHERLVEGFYRDQAGWAIDLGFPPSGWNDVLIDDVAPGWSIDLDGCTVEAGAVVHPPMAAVSYRFTYQGHSIVISGDTAACDSLVEFSRGADILVVDACAAPPPPDASPARQQLITNLHEFHASPQECVDMAAEAGVGHVVLTHHLPEGTPTVEAAAFKGRISIGNDLDRYTTGLMKR